ncbi:hypothetical protein HYV11_01765 [Candidatus Dependentiae bacterium]|nr:hypothetical protein [Candidatus Dependentiae bacterium]
MKKRMILPMTLIAGLFSGCEWTSWCGCDNSNKEKSAPVAATTPETAPHQTPETPAAIPAPEPKPVAMPSKAPEMPAPLAKIATAKVPSMPEAPKVPPMAEAPKAAMPKAVTPEEPPKLDFPKMVMPKE